VPATIRKIAAGFYSWLPLGNRVLRRVEQIVREEMDRAGAQETVLPILQPLELWQRSGRDAQYGPLMFRFARPEGDRLLPVADGGGSRHHDRRAGVHVVPRSPVNLYQVNWKYRDELRPRFGLLRTREFLMKDAYSFDADLEGLQRELPADVRRVLPRSSSGAGSPSARSRRSPVRSVAT